MTNRDVVVVGGGSAGMAAALTAHEAGVKDILRRILESLAEALVGTD